MVYYFGAHDFGVHLTHFKKHLSSLRSLSRMLEALFPDLHSSRANLQLASLQGTILIINIIFYLILQPLPLPSLRSPVWTPTFSKFPSRCFQWNVCMEACGGQQVCGHIKLTHFIFHDVISKSGFMYYVIYNSTYII